MPAGSRRRAASSTACGAFAATRPVHGECGGYMVLGRSLEDADGRTHAMAGLLPVATSYARRRLHLGYRVARPLVASALGAPGTTLVGHEFHYASVIDEARPNLVTVTDAAGADLGRAGHRAGLVSGTFFHVMAGRELSSRAPL